LPLSGAVEPAYDPGKTGRAMTKPSHAAAWRNTTTTNGAKMKVDSKLRISRLWYYIVHFTPLFLIKMPFQLIASLYHRKKGWRDLKELAARNGWHVEESKYLDELGMITVRSGEDMIRIMPEEAKIRADVGLTGHLRLSTRKPTTRGELSRTIDTGNDELDGIFKTRVADEQWSSTLKQNGVLTSQLVDLVAEICWPVEKVILEADSVFIELGYGEMTGKYIPVRMVENVVPKLSELLSTMRRCYGSS
jgi:hypothetical protein